MFVPSPFLLTGHVHYRVLGKPSNSYSNNYFTLDCRLILQFTYTFPANTMGSTQIYLQRKTKKIHQETIWRNGGDTVDNMARPTKQLRT
jgi:hypothetical protein